MASIFLSHASEDKRLVRTIARELEGHGHTYWLDERDMPLGTSIPREVEVALRSSDFVLVCYSSSAAESAWVRQEIDVTMMRQLSDHVVRLIVVRLENVDVPDLVSANLYADCFPSDKFDAAMTRIHDSMEVLLARRVAGPRSDASPVRVPAPSDRVAQNNVPRRRNRNFIGRSDVLDSMHKALESGDSVALCALAGMGGIGKTQLALEYFYLHAKAYEWVWWIRAESSSTLLHDLCELARAAGDPERSDPDQRKRALAAVRWAEQRPKTLLIYDNAVAPADLLDLLPRFGCKTIVTSRDPNWREWGATLDIDVMSEADAITLLQKRAGVMDESGARTVALELGLLPLALAQAGAYIERQRISFARYSVLFKQAGAHLLATQPTEVDYRMSLASAILLGITQLDERQLDMLRLLSFLSPDEIPKDLLTNSPRALPSTLREVDAAWFDGTFEMLRKMSLLLPRLADTTVTMHRLVQAVVRDSLPADLQATWTRDVIRLVECAFPQSSDENASICEELLPHALVALERGRAQGLQGQEMGRLYDEVGSELLRLYRLDDAREMFNHARAMNARVFGPADISVATSVTNLGLVLLEQRDTSGAADAFERARRIHVEKFGERHPEVAGDMINLGLADFAAGRLDSARDFILQALAIHVTAFDESHPQVAVDLNHLARVLASKGALEDARAAIRRGLAILDDADEYWLQAADCYTTLADIEHRDGNQQAAMNACRLAATRYEDELGAEHYKTVSALRTLRQYEAQA